MAWVLAIKFCLSEIYIHALGSSVGNIGSLGVYKSSSKYLSTGVKRLKISDTINVEIFSVLSLLAHMPADSFCRRAGGFFLSRYQSSVVPGNRDPITWDRWMDPPNFNCNPQD